MQQSAKNNSEDDNAGGLPEPETAHERLVIYEVSLTYVVFFCRGAQTG